MQTTVGHKETNMRPISHLLLTKWPQESLDPLKSTDEVVAVITNIHELNLDVFKNQKTQQGTPGSLQPSLLREDHQLIIRWHWRTHSKFSQRLLECLYLSKYCKYNLYFIWQSFLITTLQGQFWSDYVCTVFKPKRKEKSISMQMFILLSFE